MEIDSQQIGGLYLVVDPKMPRQTLLRKVEQALKGGTDLIQIWNHWPPETTNEEKENLVRSVTKIAKPFAVPVLINNDWELLKNTPLQGIHFDHLPEHFEQIQASIGHPFIAGVTCTNNIKVAEDAAKLGLDYISFCAMFPSPSVDSCEVVEPESVIEARKRTSLPIFLSGGIKPDNLGRLSDLDFDGIAVISGILSDESSEQKADTYKQTLNQFILK